MVGDVGLRLGGLRFVSLHSSIPKVYDALEKVHVIRNRFKKKPIVGEIPMLTIG